MKAILCLVSATLLTASLESAQASTPHAPLQTRAAPKASPAGSVYVPPIHVNVDGDTIESAIPITAIPFDVAGTTSGYVDNYTPTCGTSRGAPDVVYRFQAAVASTLDVALCGSQYDTELYVFEDSPAHEVACNDDYCNLQSQVRAHFNAGHVYFIVVDGYQSGAGAYALHVQRPPCFSIPPNCMFEGEPTCSDNYQDVTNGGCEHTPPAFTQLPLCDGVRVCGTYGGFVRDGEEVRDEDWYQVTPYLPLTMTLEASVDYETFVGVVDGNHGCPPTDFLATMVTPACGQASLTVHLTPGSWWVLVTTVNSGPSAGPCGGGYVFNLYSSLKCGVAVEPTTWGRIKNGYR